MPRPPRIHVPNGIYHVTLRGNHRLDIFNHDGERALLNKIVARAVEKERIRIHAYCWMTNHLHFLIQVADLPLASPMRRIASEYARAFQASLQTTGHLFENRYFATLVETDAYLLEALRYVHQNPVRAGMAADPSDYRWSSHAAYLGDRTDSWVTTDFALALFSPNRARAVVLYSAFVNELPPAEIAEQLATLEAGAPILGNREFVAKNLPPQEPRASLKEIIDDACRHFAVTISELRSPLRTSRVVTARAWVAHFATQQGVATMAAIARELNRDESSLRSAMRRREVSASQEYFELRSAD